YLDRHFAAPSPGESYRLRLTREGWLQPWVRLRANEQDETKRLSGMPPFKSMNRIEAIKPGASVVAEVETPDQAARPALVVQPFDNAEVKPKITTPDKREIEMVAEASEKAPGTYSALFAPRIGGAYRATVSVTAADGSEVGNRDTGWTVEPETEEFRTLTVNRP